MLRLITVMAMGLLLFAYGANAIEVMPYGTFNYKLSHDQNTSGTAYSKLENNGSKLGIVSTSAASNIMFRMSLGFLPVISANSVTSTG